MSEITVYCEMEQKDVPIWWCLGSQMQGRKPCPNLLEMTVHPKQKKALVVCRLTLGG